MAFADLITKKMLNNIKKSFYDHYQATTAITPLSLLKATTAITPLSLLSNNCHYSTLIAKQQLL